MNNDIALIKKYLPKNRWDDAINQLKTGYPVQYLIGNVEFLDTIINVNENVLIPRFETEFLVDKVINLIKKHNFLNPKILDIGTGSGCISIALKKHIQCQIEAIDNSNKAIKVAKNNAKVNDVDINFQVVGIEEYVTNNKYDVIISNPPYVAYESPVSDSIKYEPKNAIYADDNGLYLYKIILKKAENLIQKKHLIVLEIGYNQGDVLVNLARNHFPNDTIYYENDLNGYNRYLFIISE